MADVIFNAFSRRGLIEAATDFDNVNDGAFGKFIKEKEKLREGTYEGIRPIERIIVKVDGTTGVAAKVVNANLDRIFDNIGKAIPGAIEKITNKMMSEDADVSGIDIF